MTTAQAVLLLLQLLTLAGLGGLGLYYRRRRLPLLVEPTQRRARGILGLGGTLLVGLCWLVLRSQAIATPTGWGAVLTLVAVAVLVVLAVCMVAVAVWGSFETVIGLLDRLSGGHRS